MNVVDYERELAAYKEYMSVQEKDIPIVSNEKRSVVSFDYYKRCNKQEVGDGNK